MKFTILAMFLLCFSPVFSASTDTLTSTQSLSSNQTLISATGKFELGFFTKQNPKKYYLGIWYKDIPSDNVYVWVANRDAPSWSDSCTLKFDDQGNLVIIDDGSHVRWQINGSEAKNPVLQLLDSGNLVIREAGDSSSGGYLWQSFDHPTDTLIPGQKLGWNLKTGLNRFLTSWAGLDDPGTGNYSFKMNYHGDPEIYMRHKNKIIYRSGLGQRFSEVPEITTGNNGFNFTFYRGPDEVYYTFELPPGVEVKSRLMVTFYGNLRRFTWVPNFKRWTLYWYAMADYCDTYGVCGPYAVCTISDFFNCKCPQGFERENPQEWNSEVKSNGCVRTTELDCGKDSFLKLVNMKLPESTTAFVDEGLNLNQCRNMCKRNCSCTAYANLNLVQGVGNGCVYWTDNLTDMRNYVQGGQDLYIRLTTSDLGHNKKVMKSFAVGGAAVATIVTISVWFIRRWITQHRARKRKAQRNKILLDMLGGDLHKLEELPLFEFEKLSIATNHFQDITKLGQGGFGPVYRGKLEDGQEIAVKRLAMASRQGIEEFMNEVLVISKLQHRNLVKLLGCCIEDQEKMLVYEYMPNKSLDAYIFDPLKQQSLDWQKRFSIIEGICRGLLYLHRDSRLKIIHRDLKAANVLLDEKYNPKISDFGTARIFGGDQSQADTTRIIGTYGYMSPEYALEGQFSEKSDVFSFGVLMLEIISGKKNKWFDEESLSLLGYAWKLWSEGNIFHFIDPEIGDDQGSVLSEISKCIQVGLLCVQEDAQDRPNISNVISMLVGDTTNLSNPKSPGFTRCQVSIHNNRGSLMERHHSNSMNFMSISSTGGR